MDYVILAFAALCVCAAAAADSPARPQPDRFVEFDPPTLLLPSQEQQDVLRRRFAAEPTVADDFAGLIAAAEEATTVRPTPIAAIRYEGLVSNHPDRIATVEKMQDMLRLRAECWAYILTGEPRFATSGVKRLHAWATTYQPIGNDVNENKLDATVLARQVFAAHLTDAQRRDVDAWLMDIARRHADAMPAARAGNRLAKRVKIVASIASVLNDPALRQHAINGFDRFVELTFQPDGTTYDFHHRDALHYHLGSVEPGVLMLLTMRDPARTLDTTVGKSGSVRNGLDFVVPYVRGEKVHREWVNSQVDLDRRRFEQGDEYYRPGKPWTADYRARRLFELAGAIDPKYRDIARIIPARPDEIDVVFEYLINGR